MRRDIPRLIRSIINDELEERRFPLLGGEVGGGSDLEKKREGGGA